MKGVLAKRWITDLKEDVVAAPSIINSTNKDQSRILVGTKQGKLFMLNQTGDIQWMYDTQAQTLTEEEKLFIDDKELYSINTAPKIITNPKTKEVLIILGTEEGKIHCITASGKKKWIVQTEGPIRSTASTMIAGSNKEIYLLVGSHDEHIYIINLEGKVVKRLHVTEPVETNPIIVHQKIIVGTAQGNAVAIDIEGKMIWNVKTNNRISADLTHTKNLKGEDIILVPSEDNNLYAISIDGEILWRTPTNGALLSKPAILQTTPESKEILIGSADNSMYCLNLEDGELLWSYETDFWIACTPAIEKGKNYTYAVVGSYDNNVYVLDAQGSYELDFIPGLGGIVNQGTFQMSSMGQDAGNDKGKVLSQYHTQGFIVGCNILAATEEVIAVTKKGKIYNLKLT